MTPYSSEQDDMKDTRVKLNNAVDEVNIEDLQQVLSDVIGEMTVGTDVSSLFPDMVKVCANTNLACKKLVSMYISQYAQEKPDLTLLAINCLYKDCSDPNAMVRGLALKTLCNIRLPEFLEYVKQPLLSGLKDKSAYVRQMAVTGCVKTHQLNSQFTSDNPIAADLHEKLLSDTDGIVIIHAIQALRIILNTSPNITQRTAFHLLNKLPTLSSWGIAYVLDFLLIYIPKSEEETFDIMNVLDHFFKHNKFSVVMAAVKLMLHLTKGMPDVQKDIHNKLKGILLNLLSHEQDEIVYLSLCHLHYLQKNFHKDFARHYKKLFCRYNDPIYIKCKKIELMEMICNPENSKEVLEELNSHCLDMSPEVSERSIRAISNIAKKSNANGESAIQALMKLLEIERVAGLALNAMKDLLDLDKFKSYSSDILHLIPSLWSTVEGQKGKVAMLWIIGQYGKTLPDAPYLMEAMIDNLEEESRVSVLCNLLTATIKLFFFRPAECQDMLGKLLQFCVENQNDLYLHEKGQFYYKLLEEDISLAEEVICSPGFDREADTPSTTSITASVDVVNHLNMFIKLSRSERVSQSKACDTTAAQVETSPSSMQEPSEPVEGQLIDINSGIKGQEEVSDTKAKLNASNRREEYSVNLKDLKDVKLDKDDPPKMDEKCKIEMNKEKSEEGDNDGKRQDGDKTEGDMLQLDKSFQMVPEDFESWWKALGNGVIENCTTVSYTSSLVDFWEKEGIVTMATTPDGIYPWRAFLYAKKEDSESTIFLVELTIANNADTSITIQLKCTEDIEMDRRKFLNCLQRILSK